MDQDLGKRKMETAGSGGNWKFTKGFGSCGMERWS